MIKVMRNGLHRVLQLHGYTSSLNTLFGIVVSLLKKRLSKYKSERVYFIHVIYNQNSCSEAIYVVLGSTPRHPAIKLFEEYVFLKRKFSD